MTSEGGPRRSLPDQHSGSGRSFSTPRHQSITEPLPSKRVCFYKSGDPQFGGLRMVINNRTFKTFDALLDSLSKKVPLAFGVRNITTPRGVHTVRTLDELEDGKSYICSDSRKVRPVDLALARRKPPPWYHARPVSSRRRAVQQGRLFPGQGLRTRERAAVRTPRKLLVFRNGEPAASYTAVLDKRDTPTFESILEQVAALMRFPVAKLHTVDGRRVEGLPGLILCSGVVVAAGREPFRPASYTVQRAAAPAATLKANRSSLRRLKGYNHKKKSLSYSSPTSRKFSPSSERFIVNRIHDSMSGSFDLPSNPANSFELEPGHVLESVVETEEEEEEVGGGAAAEGGQGSLLPADDDIEKSFRVNQDGSMTVEMRVRLTLKEEETVHWTTTLSRSSAASQPDGTCLVEAEEEVASVKSLPLDLSSPAVDIDTFKRDKTDDDDDEEPPPPLGSRALTQNREEEEVKVQRCAVSPRKAQAPAHTQIRRRQESVESVQSVSADGSDVELLGSYSYREEAGHGAVAQQYCQVKQTKPVPKPRRFGSVDGNRNVMRIKSAGMTEIMQIESSGEEVTETVLHIYEQQTCQDNFLANLFPAPAPEFPFCRPLTSGSGQLQGKFEPDLWRPSTASESVSLWRAENTSEFANANSVQEKNVQPPSRLSKGTSKAQKSQRGQGGKKHTRQLVTPGKRQKDASKKQTRAKSFSSVGFLRKIYGNKAKPGKSVVRVRPRQVRDGNLGLTDEVVKDSIVKNEPGQSANGRNLLTRQTSLHQEKKNSDESCLIRATAKEASQYVESWLENVHRTSTDYRQLEGRGDEDISKEELSETHTSHFGLRSEPLTREASVKQRIQSFEHKSERKAADQAIGSSTRTNTDKDKSSSSAHTQMQEPQSRPPTEPLSENEHKSAPVKISLFDATPSGSFSADLPLPPPPSELMELSAAEDAASEVVPSAASSPLYKLSPVGSHTSDSDLLFNSPAQEEPSSARIPPAKRAPLLSNQSLDRTMSLRKDHADQYTLCNEVELPPGETYPQENSVSEAQDGSSCCSSVCPASSLSERTSTGSVSSTEALSPSQRVNKPHLSPKKQTKRAKLQSSRSPERKSPKSRRHDALDTSPLTKRKLNKSLSPYSQPLNVTSPPVRQRSSSRTLSRKLSLDEADETQRKRQQCAAVHEAEDAELETPAAESQLQPPQETSVTQPNMRPVLEEICHSIKSIRRITHSKRQSCLEKSNSLPDFSSHVASTFGSSSKALLAFLSVMTLKDTNSGGPGAPQLEDGGAVSCPEALRMIDSLREIATIEDSKELRASLSALQRSASEQLMQSWRGFQELSHRSKSSTPDAVVVSAGAGQQDVNDEIIIDELVKDLDLPAELKEELHSLSVAFRSNGGKVEGERMEETACVDVSAIVKQFSNSHKMKSSSGANTSTRGGEEGHEEEQEKLNPTVEITKELSQEERETNTADQEKLSSSAEEEEEEKQSCQERESTHEEAGEGDMLEMCTRSSEVEDDNCVMQDGEHSCDDQREQNIFSTNEDAGRDYNSEHEHVLSSGEGKHLSTDDESERKEQDGRESLSEVQDEMRSSCYAELSTSEEGKDTSHGESDDQLSLEEKHFEEDGSAEQSDDARGKPGEEVGPSAEETTCYSDLAETSSEEGGEVSVKRGEGCLHHPKGEENTEDHLADDTQIEHQDSHSEEDVVVICDALDKQHRFSTDADSGKHYSSCEEQVEFEGPDPKDKRPCSSIGEELSFFEKELNSEEEEEEEEKENRSSADTYMERRCADFQGISQIKTQQDKNLDRVEEIISQSIAERVVLLEKQVAEAQRSKHSAKPARSPLRRPAQRNAAPQLQSDGEDSELPASHSALQSSLSFSYDSCSGVGPTESEGSRVRSIREMFLAKSSVLQHHGHGRCFPSPDGSALSEPRPDTSVSGGYQSQTSGELSSSEDGSPRKSIAKGFVRRTIERLYGWKEAEAPARREENEEEEEEQVNGQPPLAANQKKGKGFSSIFSPFRGARCKAVSELSYFHSANGLDTLGEAARCLAFNAQVGPGEGVATIDGGCWLLGDEAAVRKSVSDPVGINKALAEPLPEESTPYSLFSTAGPELEEVKRPASGKCTYFSLPHASDSDLCQEEVKETAEVEVVADAEVNVKVGSEKNGRLPAVADFKMKDNKVHPLVETPPDGEAVVVAQPKKGHGVVSRRVQDPDVLDLLYDFCGQNCPIL